MSSIFKLNISKMVQEAGNVSKYCEAYGLDRKAVYQLNNRKRFNSDDQIKLAEKLEKKLKVAYWEDKQ